MFDLVPMSVMCLCGQQAVYRNGLQSEERVGDGWECPCGFTLIVLPQNRD